MLAYSPNNLNNPEYSVALGKERIALFVIEDGSAYWVGHTDPGRIYRILSDSGSVETVAETAYTDGRVDFIQPIVSGDWLIFGDTSVSAEFRTWDLRAVNIVNRNEKQILKIYNDQEAINTFHITTQDHQVVWSIVTSQGKGNFEDTITIEDLETGERTCLTRESVNGAIWSELSLSNGYLAVEKDYDENHGGGSDIFLVNLTDGLWRQITSNAKGSMPRIDYPWLFWKSTTRFQTAEQIVVMNLINDEKQIIPTSTLEASDPKIDGKWVYWTGFPSLNEKKNALYCLDLESWKIGTFRPDAENQFLQNVVIHRNWIAWLRIENFLSRQSTSYLEWTTFP